MTEPKFTLNEFAEMIKKNKWHIIYAEDAIKTSLKRGYGEITIKYILRAGVVEQVVVTNVQETILRPKEGHPHVDEDQLTIQFLQSK